MDATGALATPQRGDYPPPTSRSGKSTSAFPVNSYRGDDPPHRGEGTHRLQAGVGNTDISIPGARPSTMMRVGINMPPATAEKVIGSHLFPVRHNGAPLGDIGITMSGDAALPKPAGYGADFQRNRLISHGKQVAGRNCQPCSRTRPTVGKVGATTFDTLISNDGIAGCAGGLVSIFTGYDPRY